MSSQPKLGVELSGTISEHPLFRRDRNEQRHSIYTSAPLPGSIEAITWLAGPYMFKREVLLVSSLPENEHANARLWLAHHNFFNRTGLERWRLRFVANDAEKLHAVRSLKITHFIEPRLDGLVGMSAMQHRCLFDPSGKEEQKLDRIRDTATGATIRVVHSWDDAVRYMTHAVT